MKISRLLFASGVLSLGFTLPSSAAIAPDADRALQGLDPVFEKFVQENHVPGLVYGVVVDGRLVRVRGFGVQDLKTNAPVTADTVFRIASMSKQLAALAVLRLRDAGKVSLEAPAEQYIPELRKWHYPTTDSPKITVRDLLSHGAGLVTDDPWGDRQLAMSEPDFSRLLLRGVPFSRAPETAYEYSNFGFALVGRLITRQSGMNYADYVTRSIVQPLGMRSTSYDIANTPAGKRALGYRWENDAWLEEPMLGPGVFGAMGGLTTTANDYARYVAWVLGAWPARDGPEDQILRRSSVREIARPANYAVVIPAFDTSKCPRANAYGFGLHSANDCILGFHIVHSGGLPGFGSNVLMMPNRGVGIFAFANRTYAPASRVVREAANLLVESAAFPARAGLPSPQLQAMVSVALRVYSSGDFAADQDSFAVNFWLDKNAALRKDALDAVKQKYGDCHPEPIDSDTAMSATFSLTCDGGTLAVKLVLAPTLPATIQTLEFGP
jgi:D-alanyl-D-alanine-carboxypeptidase/D-alanyl-D-alanine-endopeptidase